jgi:ADP-heptose:LPS heptosyltransferase
LTVRTLLTIAHGGARTVSGLLDQARALKAAGLHAPALAILSELDESCAPIAALIEKGLIAKINGRFDIAARLFERCYKLEPSDFLRNELAMVLPEVEPLSAILERWSGDAPFLAVANRHPYFRRALESIEPMWAPRTAGLAPEIAFELRGASPRPEWNESIEVLGLGGGERWTPRGAVRLLRRIDFVRVRTASRDPLVRLRVRVDGRTLSYTAGSLLERGFESSPLHHQIFNCWLDLSGIEPGLHEVQLYFEELRGGYRTHQQPVWIDPTERLEDARVSAALTTSPAGEGDVEEWLGRMPSERFGADRSYFQGQLTKILVLRADQLGDSVLSLPAMVALRRHFPQAELHGLFGLSQVELMRGTGLFSKVHGVHFAYDQAVRGRFLSLEEQSELREQLAPHCYDLAIDLSPGSHSRPLLKLAGARYTAGFQPNDFPWLSFGIDVRTRDPGNGHEAISHANSPETLVEALALAVKRKPVHLPKTDLSPIALAEFKIPSERRFAVVHAGARTASRKWPLSNFLDVARLLIRKRGLFVVLILDHPDDCILPLPDDLSSTDLRLVTHQPTFTEFDGLISQCAVFIGNDSGPKHLAALRGTPVVSVHMGAVNWSEWGQDGSGFIVTRRVPCYGCGIELVEECGKGLPCLMQITPNEIFDSANELL